ncbi:uncharacterized protein L969DRAFT_599447 [Mixia osmundae IAM 14324]|uniref:Uncharacterized protein n=1 Tax=Mixia osmundae (strain CBS 9802 / IAM 14324 / JCM 22182 / KY 12970) TaxID=764103 RepID=G7E4X0_MIXOS|nr:uncharacterized protein L969DRAFT_599447 [Mixia osmundae IAM 14324]KEI37742.1 hypothetical protein L969DRAFT_599447 [Mixia osmundae IAM 14324]GAA97880.1 hypothetical protein E5Q_04560 [Mixia osmundae IAM 14324]
MAKSITGSKIDPQKLGPCFVNLDCAIDAETFELLTRPFREANLEVLELRLVWSDRVTVPDYHSFMGELLAFPKLRKIIVTISSVADFLPLMRAPLLEEIRLGRHFDGKTADCILEGLREQTWPRLQSVKLCQKTINLTTAESGPFNYRKFDRMATALAKRGMDLLEETEDDVVLAPYDHYDTDDEDRIADQFWAEAEGDFSEEEADEFDGDEWSD